MQQCGNGEGNKVGSQENGGSTGKTRRSLEKIGFPPGQFEEETTDSGGDSKERSLNANGGFPSWFGNPSLGKEEASQRKPKTFEIFCCRVLHTSSHV